jgi:murein DD-endopeptidase MepM/ murein hydrolase activator NlpD
MAGLVLWPLACATSGGRPLHDDGPAGTWHIVKPGETSAQIAQEAGIPLEDLLEINGLRRDQVLEPGRLVFVLTQAVSSTARPAPERPPVPPSEFPSKGALLHWPLAKPVLSSPFGARWGREHEGIDMQAVTGTPVLAAGAGEVLYAGDKVRGYGKMVVLQHAGDVLTVYAHNSAVLVRTGDRIAVGQEIARVGSTGHSTGPHLHFEVRRGQVPQDPMQFLPPLK